VPIVLTVSHLHDRGDCRHQREGHSIDRPL